MELKCKPCKLASLKLYECKCLQDGGCSCPGDIAKAIGAGADFVMLGGMLAGHDQSGGEVTVKPSGQKVKLFYGMSSSTAMEKHSGGVAEYRSVTQPNTALGPRSPHYDAIK